MNNGKIISTLEPITATRYVFGSESFTNPSSRCRPCSHDLFFRNVDPHSLISHLVRTPSLALRRIQVVPGTLPIPRRRPLPTGSKRNLWLARIITPPMRITETRLALVVAAALHTEATFGATGAYSPVAILICVTVLGVAAWIATCIGRCGAKWARWCEERICCVEMALGVDSISGNGVAAERIVRVEVVLRAAVPGLDGGALLARLTGSGRTCEMRETGLFAIASVPNLPRLGLGGTLADAVLAQKIRTTAIRSIAEIAFTAEGARALLRDVRIQWERGQVCKSARGRREIFGPVEVGT